jgi:hypothetical protein
MTVLSLGVVSLGLACYARREHRLEGRCGSREEDPTGLRWEVVVPMGRIELPTSPLPRECSTTEPHGHFCSRAFALKRETSMELATSILARLRSDQLSYSRFLAPRPGLEPGTYGLTVRRSTN